jgi:hypothetical protein
MQPAFSTGYRQRRQSAAPSSEECIAAVRAFRAARACLRKQIKSVEAAAARFDSNVAFVQAAVGICQGDSALGARIVRGGLPLAEVPRRVARRTAC